MPEQQSAVATGWVGHVLAGHRVDALIGEGGMGVVYRATHLRLGRTVALKVLPPSLAADLDYRRRFEREAAIAASLEHPNVVPIYDAGHAAGVLYLSMRFVDGEDLGSVLRREGRLGLDGVCAVLGPVADALDAVHGAGLVHRDVKPAGRCTCATSASPRGRRSRAATSPRRAGSSARRTTPPRSRSRAGGWTGAPTSTGWPASCTAASPVRCPTRAPRWPR